jgi:hypothetical protein
MTRQRHRGDDVLATNSRPDLPVHDEPVSRSSTLQVPRRTRLTMHNSTRSRRPDRLKMFFIALDLLSDREWFSARQLTQALYFGREPFRQQFKYVQEVIDDCVTRGDIIRDDTVAACPLYRTSTRVPRGSTGLVLFLIFKAYPIDWHADQVIAMNSLMNDLDRFAPHEPNLKDYDLNGRLPVPPPAYDPDCPYPPECLPESGEVVCVCEPVHSGPFAGLKS